MRKTLLASAAVFVSLLLVSAPARAAGGEVQMPYELDNPNIATNASLFTSVGDENKSFVHSPIVLTSETGDLVLHSGDVLTGTGGPYTHVCVADGATVTLCNVDITDIVYGTGNSWSAVTCLGDATIILQGTNVLKSGCDFVPGIYAWPGKTLAISGDGTLDVSSINSGAGIGGGVGSGRACGDIVIAGGTIVASGGDGAAGIGSGVQSSCGTITILGGTVIAIGSQNAPGIGCGTGAQSSCGDITIAGGSVRAIGLDNGAGIGSGSNGMCGDITISGGDVNVIGGQDGAGIGSGSDGTCGDITISAGTVTASGDHYSPGIGNGINGVCGKISRLGGNVTALGGQNGAGIGSSLSGTCYTITIAGGTVIATGDGGSAGIGAGLLSACADIIISGGTVFATGGRSSAGIGGGSRGTCGNIVIDENVTLVSATHGIDCNNAIGEGCEGTVGTMTIAEGLLDVTEGATRTITNQAAVNSYAVWATASGVSGAWNETDTLGIPNVFRYVFGKPTGAFTNPPLISISFDALGRPVIHTPPLSLSVTGFNLFIRATDTLDGDNSTTYPLDPSGETVIPETDKPTRFFRLRAEEQ